jgi:predicted MPP superfamily phosphohydrolase
MRSSVILSLILAAIVILSDTAIGKELAKKIHPKRLIKLHYGLMLAFLAGIVCLMFMIRHAHDGEDLQKFMWFNWLLLAIYLPKLLFVLLLLADKLIFRWFHWRYHPLKWTGLVLAACLFTGFVYGAFYGRTDIEIKHVIITDEKLPAGFDNMKIVQISDLHVGSMGMSTPYWHRAAGMINSLRPDMVVMTGDMIDNFASELGPPVMDALHGIRAPLGKYAILGNHDYGDYTRWPSATAKQANLDSLLRRESRMGFRVLLDENLPVCRGGDTLTLAGVQNWSKPPFHCYGNLAKALNGTGRRAYVLLLSHDPNHWLAQVAGYPSVRLMLAGHTHGMQLGINKFGIHWSPAQWMFRQWDGLYEHNGQQLYVSRGLGYIGIPMRLGMPPEITVITLKRK